MAGFLFKLETTGGETAEPPTLSSAVPTWKAGDTIPLGDRTLHVVAVRADAPDSPPVLVVEDDPVSGGPGPDEERLRGASELELRREKPRDGGSGDDLHAGPLIRLRASVVAGREWLVEGFLSDLLKERADESLIVHGPVMLTVDEQAARSYARASGATRWAGRPTPQQT